MRKIVVTVCIVVGALLATGSQEAFSQQTNRTFVAFSLKAAQAKVAQCAKEGVDFRRKYPEIYQLGYITRPVGLVVDKENEDIVIVGERRPLPPIYLDDLVVALRAIYVAGEEHPGVSIDPVGDEKNPRTQVVQFRGPLQDTRFGKVCFESDYLLKKIGLNEEPLRVKGVKTFFDLSVEEISQSKGARKWTYSRFWFMPAADCHIVVGNVVILRPIDLQVFTEIMRAEVDGRRIEDAKNYYHHPSKEFARLFTNAYDEVAKEKVVLEELRQMGRLVSLMRGLKQTQEQPKLDYWLTEFAVSKVETPREVAVLRKESKEVGMQASGGVRLGSVILNAKGDPVKLVKAALLTRPSKDVVTWEFELTGNWDVTVEPGDVDQKKLGELFVQALFLEEQKRYDAAIEVYGVVLQLSPNLDLAYYGRGNVHAGKRDYNSAIADYDRVIALNPNYAVAYNNRGAVYTEGKKQYDGAIEDFNKAIELNPKYAGAYNNRGITYRNKHLYDRAIADYDKAIELIPGFAEAHTNRGSAYSSKGLYDRAIADHNKSIELNPNLAAAYNNRGITYVEGKKQYDRAIVDFNKAIELKPDNVEAYTNRGAAYFGKQQYDQAIEDCNKAIIINSNYALAYNNRGLSYAEGKRQYDRAIADYNEAIALDSNCYEAYYNRARSYMIGKGQYDRAIADFDTAIAINPNLVLVYINKAIVYEAMKRLKESIAAYRKFIELAPAQHASQIQYARERIRELDSDVLSSNEADRLISQFKVKGRPSAEAHIALVKMGSAVIPALCNALENLGIFGSSEENVLTYFGVVTTLAQITRIGPKESVPLMLLALQRTQPKSNARGNMLDGLAGAFSTSKPAIPYIIAFLKSELERESVNNEDYTNTQALISFIFIKMCQISAENAEAILDSLAAELKIAKGKFKGILLTQIANLARDSSRVISVLEQALRAERDPNMRKKIEEVIEFARRQNR